MNADSLSEASTRLQSKLCCLTLEIENVYAYYRQKYRLAAVKVNCERGTWSSRQKKKLELAFHNITNLMVAFVQSPYEQQ